MSQSKYRGISYPRFLQFDWLLSIWKRLMCSKEYHLFNECLSMKHYLYCDACGLTIYIDNIKEEE